MSDYWKDNGIEKPQQYIVCAANRCNGVILCGARHWDSVMRCQYNAMPNTVELKPNGAMWEQGFIDQFGDFVTRGDALAIVLSNEQTFNAERNGSKTKLFSEGLY